MSRRTAARNRSLVIERLDDLRAFSGGEDADDCKAADDAKSARDEAREGEDGVELVKPGAGASFPVAL